MSDILSTFLSSESLLKRNKYQNKYISGSNKIFLDNGLRLSKEGNILKLPKFNNNFKVITENDNNKSFEDLNSNKRNEILLIYNSENEYNNIFKNQYLSDLNSQSEKKDEKKHHKNGKMENEQIVKNKKNSSKPKNKNKYTMNEKFNNIHEIEMKKQKYIDDYIDSLLIKGREKKDKFNEAAKKLESYKFSMAHSINPKKYIQKQILDDSFNYNQFKSTKIQEDCFNGNQKFREANYKNIKINIMNNVFLDSMEAEPEETNIPSQIDKMIDEQRHINTLKFGKNVYNRKDEETLTLDNNKMIF